MLLAFALALLIPALTHDDLPCGHAHVPQRLLDGLTVRLARATDVFERDVGDAGLFDRWAVVALVVDVGSDAGRTVGVGLTFAHAFAFAHAFDFDFDFDFDFAFERATASAVGGARPAPADVR